MSGAVAQLLSAVEALSEADRAEFQIEYARRHARLMERLRADARAELNLQTDDEIERWAQDAVSGHRSRGRAT